jgi:hypothetical protein
MSIVGCLNLLQPCYKPADDGALWSGLNESQLSITINLTFRFLAASMQSNFANICMYS